MGILFILIVGIVIVIVGHIISTNRKPKTCENCCHYIANMFCKLETGKWGLLKESFCKWRIKGFMDKFADRATNSFLDGV